MFSFTRQEKLVLAFVGATCLVGLGLNFYQKNKNSLDIQKIIEEQKSSLAVNLNKAGLNDLARISAIGPALAEMIINFRNHNGPFKSLEALKLIKGIDENKFNQIKNLLIID
jgi:competence ComEA-like helix-hairpin-helix protein